jgi:hypothetical protein
MWMCERRSGPRFRRESLQVSMHAPRVKQLDSYRSIEQLITRFVHRRHATAADSPLELIEHWPHISMVDVAADDSIG